MAAIEQEILESVNRLDPEQKQLVLALVQELAGFRPPQVTLGEWLALAEASLAETRTKYGEGFTVGSLNLLDEAREERFSSS
jgi:hypothetical protein